jgi:hypothetical protein
MNIFEVLHSRKIKTMVGCIELLKHNLRNKDNLAEFTDTTKSDLNIYTGTTVEDFFKKFEELTSNLPRKIQRNASRLLEVLISFSSEFSEGWEDNPELKSKIDSYFNTSEKFLNDRYGNVIISRTDHFDEKTPHVHFLLVPICTNKDGIKKFSSSEFLGGRKGLFDLHDQFHKQVGINFGLERGVRDGRTKHSGLKNYEEWEKSQKINFKLKETAINDKEDLLNQKEADLTMQEDLLKEQQEEISQDKEKVKEQKEEIAQDKIKIEEEQEKIALDNKRIDEQQMKVAQEMKMIEEQKEEITQKKINLDKQQAEITQEKTSLEKQQEEIIRNKEEVEVQKKQLIKLTGDAMERTAELSRRKLEDEEIKKNLSKQIPEVPLPPAVSLENTRKTWRDKVQSTVDSAFNKLTAVVLSFKTKYDELLEKYLKLVAVNETNKKRAEKAERDLLEKPLDAIIASRKPSKQTVTVKDNTHDRKGHNI